MSDSDVQIVESDVEILESEAEQVESEALASEESEYEMMSSDEEQDTLYESEVDNLPSGSGTPANPIHVPVFTVITPSELAKQQTDAIRGVCEILGCTDHEARRLLMYVRWSSEALFGVITDRGQDRVYEKAGLPPEGPAAPPKAQGDILCQICFCDATPEESLMMDCGHTFCKDCWLGHCRVQISEGASSRILCMQDGCKKFCNAQKIKQLLKDEPQLASRYTADLDSSYVDDNPDACWCPSVPHCGNAVRAEKNAFCEPSCSCGHCFCFACKGEPHSPCTCDMWKRWKQKCEDDSETLNWITANAKPCPKCLKMVEKNGGCNLVYCRCGQTFCWLCGQSTGSAHTWTTINGHTCGQYKADADRIKDAAAQNVKRYLHYHNRWAGMNKSAEEEARSGQEVTKKLAEVEGTGMQGSIIDHSWVISAYKQLHEVRKILANSYVFAFYMFSNTIYKEEITEEQNQINQNLFEAQQQDLAVSVEHTSKLLRDMGSAIEEINPEIRLEVINMTKNLDKRLENLYHAIENDILAKLMFSCNDISYYKGMRPTLMAENATFVPTNNAAAPTRAAATTKAAATPAPVEPKSPVTRSIRKRARR